MRDHFLMSHKLEPQKVKCKVGEAVEENIEKVLEEVILEEEIRGDLLVTPC